MKNPKHTITFQVLLIAMLSTSRVGGESASFGQELHYRIINTTEAKEPQLFGDTFLFSYQAPVGTQFVSLALENEKYQFFHNFERNRHGVFILKLPVPQGIETLRYRLVVDGLWLTDPKAPSIRDSRGIPVSSLNVPSASSEPAPGTLRLPDGRVRFVYYGQKNARVSLVGDFNRWDPYLTPMKESPVRPGVYETTLRIPAGASYYHFVVNGKDIPDPAGASKAVNGWGQTASILP